MYMCICMYIYTHIYIVYVLCFYLFLLVGGTKYRSKRFLGTKLPLTLTKADQAFHNSTLMCYFKTHHRLNKQTNP